MRPIFVTTVAALLVALSAAIGCASPRVFTNVEPGIDFAGFETFALAPPPRSVPGLPGYSEILGRAMQDILRRDLVGKGFSEADWDAADLQVAFDLGGESRAEVWGTGGWTGSVRTSHFVQGALHVDVVDRRSSVLVWHGWTSGRVYSHGAEREAKQALREVIAEFPPGPAQ